MRSNQKGAIYSPLDDKDTEMGERHLTRWTTEELTGGETAK